MSTSVYPIADLVCLQGTKEFELIAPLFLETIQRVVDYNTWAGNGGVGSLAFEPSSLSLVVTNSEYVHRELAQLLSDLRRAAAATLHALKLEPSALSTMHDLVLDYVRDRSDFKREWDFHWEGIFGNIGFRPPIRLAHLTIEYADGPQQTIATAPIYAW